MGLGNDAEDLAAGDGNGDVEEASVDLQRQPDKGSQAKLGGGLTNLSQGLQGARQQGALAE